MVAPVNTRRPIKNPGTIVQEKKNKMNASAFADGGLQFPDDLPENFFFSITLSTYKYSRLAGNVRTPIKPIYLPIPAALSEAYAINYEDNSLGVIAGQAAAVAIPAAGAALGGGSVRGAATAMISSLKNSVTQTVRDTKKMNAADALATINAGASDFAKGIGAGAAKNIAELGLGQAPNPHVVALFKGVPLRSHSFSWDLLPRTPFEAATIDEIILQLKKAALPEKGTLGGLTLKYPMESECAIITGGAQNTIVFKPTFITNVGIDYSSAGGGYFKDGRPLGKKLSLSFKEMDIWLADDFNETPSPSSGFGVAGGPF